MAVREKYKRLAVYWEEGTHLVSFWCRRGAWRADICRSARSFLLHLLLVIKFIARCSDRWWTGFTLDVHFVLAEPVACHVTI